MEQLIGNIAKALADAPDEVNLNITEGDPIVIELRVAPADLGKMIGKQGRTARSIRTILTAAGLKQHRHFSLNIVE